MIKTFLFLILSISAITNKASADSLPYGDQFKSGNLRKNYLKWSSSNKATTLVTEGDINYLKLQKGNKVDALIKRVPITPSTKYRLSFKSKVEGPDILKENSQLESLFFVYNKNKAGHSLPGWRLAFYTEENKKVWPKYPQFFNVIMSGEWTLYQEEFYPPANAATMSLVLSNGNPENTLFVTDLNLDNLSNDKTINLNPDFAHGLYNYSGWNYVHKGKIIRNKEQSGSFQMDCTDGWVIGDPIPVKAGANYKISFSIKGTHHKKRAGLRVEYFNKNNEKIGRTKKKMTAKAGQQTKDSYTFQTPANCSYLKIILGSGQFQYIRLLQVKN